MKKNKIWLQLGFVLAVLSLFIWLGRPADQVSVKDVSGAAASDTVLVAEQSYYEFGQISMANGPVMYQFKLRNTGNGPVTLRKLYTSCMCTKALLQIGAREVGPFGMPGHGGAVPGIKELVAAGEEFTVQAIFDPAAHGPAGVGRIERVVYLENTAGDPVELQFGATVTP